MTITEQVNGNQLVVKLEGRLDTNTAPELEAFLNDHYEGVEALEMDFEALDYISSAGLRVLLAAQKKMNKQGSMVVTHVCDDIMEVFEITGFADVLTIQ